MRVGLDMADSYSGSTTRLTVTCGQASGEAAQPLLKRPGLLLPEALRQLAQGLPLHDSHHQVAALAGRNEAVAPSVLAEGFLAAMPSCVRVPADSLASVLFDYSQRWP